ncbi:MAG: DUF1015 domain-containing protein [Candidatus Methylumidiphilus sp.]
MNFANIALHVPTILLPNPQVDLRRWAVIACDQYTSQADYWNKVEHEVGDAASTLRLTFPEIYLEDADKDERISHINAAMRAYLADGTLAAQQPGFILVDRQTAHAPSRKGLVVALDLECYDFSVGSTTLIRATEGTIVERLPPRIKVRENAEIELPHIMVLIDDPDKTVIEPLFELALNKVYDFDLMLNGGHIQGYLIDDPAQLAAIAQALAQLAGIALAGEPTDDVLLYAMGDGNHSFATAKAIWEKLKAEAADKQAILSHPARYALVELVNLHDAGLEFEAIHRVLFKSSLAAVLKGLAQYCAEGGMGFSQQTCATLAEAQALAAAASDTQHAIPYLAQGGYGVAFIDSPKLTLEVASLQTFLDAFLKQNPGTELDYIHGVGAVEELSGKPGAVGFLLPTLSKFHLFKSIAQDGALPRKTFSMGEADEKRFYLECRKITA